MRFAASSNFSDWLSAPPDFAGMSALSMDAASSERMSGIQSELKVQSAGLDSMTQIKSAAHKARGIEAGGQAQAAATRASGMSSMIGSIAGGIGSMDFGGGGGGSSYDFSSPTWTNAQSSFGDFYRSQ